MSTSLAERLAFRVALKKGSDHAFVAELLAKAKLAQEVRDAGVSSLTLDFQHGVDWLHLFETSNKLDIFFAYGRTWRAIYSSQLRALARNQDARVRVVLPDPENSILMGELARRFGMSSEQVKSLVVEAAADFQRMFIDSSDAKAQFSLWYLPESPVFSFYRFDTTTVLALYTHRKDRPNVPTFIVEKRGWLHDFITDEFSSFVQENSPLAQLNCETAADKTKR